jgi:cytochrome o ubiquinol oxidase operon protein cyoD
MPTFKSYLTGFVLSVALTLLAFYFVTAHISSGHILYSHNFLTVATLALALVQAVIQMLFFLHLNKGENARWNLAVFGSTVCIILILVIGSIWIMGHLNYNMTPQDMNTYMINYDNIIK